MSPCPFRPNFAFPSRHLFITNGSLTCRRADRRRPEDRFAVSATPLLAPTRRARELPGGEGDFMRKTIVLTGAAAAGVLAISMAVTGPAQADPKFVPDKDDIVGVGSDTTEFVVQDLSKAFN